MAWYWWFLIGYSVAGIILLIVNRKDIEEALDVWITGLLGPAIIIVGAITWFLFIFIPRLIRKNK